LIRRNVRYFYKENRQFCFYSRGSLQETKTWIRKAFNRGVITEEIFQEILNDIETLSVKLNNYIKTIGNTKTTNDDS
jgi:four helix bundle protein